MGNSVVRQVEMVTHWSRVGQADSAQVFLNSLSECAVCFTYIQMVAVCACYNVYQVRILAAEMSVNVERATRSCDDSRLVDMSAAVTSRPATWAGAWKLIVVGVRLTDNGGNQLITEVRTSFVCNKGWLRKDVGQEGIGLEHPEVFQEDLFDREVVLVVGKD